MSGFEQLQIEARQLRTEAGLADAQVSAVRAELLGATRELDLARQTADPAAIVAAEARRKEAADRERELVAAADAARSRIDERIIDVIGGHGPADVVAGVDRQLPIVLLPVRLETRFDVDANGGPVLKVRIYPDDVHVDDHEPALSEDEAAAGRAYWTAIAAGTPEGEAWAGLAGLAGPYRALWIRDALRPAGDQAGWDAAALAFPAVALRAPGTSRPAVARALPDLFIVRVRAGGTVRVVHGRPVADRLQVGVDMSTPAAPEPSPADAGPPAGGGGPAPERDPSVLAEGMAWMTDFAAAEAAGMGVTVALPAGTDAVDDVTVVGVCVSIAPTDAATLLGELIDAHHVTHGAGFIAPGTPTNNLADSGSGWTSRPDPARLDPSGRGAVAPDANAAVLARAIGAPLDRLEALPGAGDADDREARAMQRALFETTWGPYLRQQAQPGFPLAQIPRVYHHVTEYVRGGGPLPAIRLGRQPYGVLPIQPRGWTAAGDDAFVRWLGENLAGLRRLWLAGIGSAPSGLAMYSHEPVSSRVRVRTSNASSTRPFFGAFGIDGEGDQELQERRLLAELGIAGVMPNVIRQIFIPGHVDLWLPMSVDGDVAVAIRDPKPKEAASILGLLLRNAALQVTSAAADEYRAGMEPGIDPQLVAWSVRQPPVASVAAAAGIGVATDTAFVTTPPTTLSELLDQQGVDAAGHAVRIADGIDALLADGAMADLDRYRNSDAVIAFRAALADLAAIPTERRARLVGEVLDTASHRYDAWVTSLATRRLSQLRATRPDGAQIGAWGTVRGVRRRTLDPVAGRPDLPEGTALDPANRGFVVAPSLGHAHAAGVIRAAWIANGGPGADAEAPFAVSLESRHVRRALELAEGMRNGQLLGALLGYRIERDLHDASGAGVEVDWAVYELRRRYPLRIATDENAAPASERLVADGWRIAQDELAARGSVAPAVAATGPAGVVAGEVAAIQAAIDDAVAALDALTDLGLAEAMHQLAGRNYDRATAATDMIGRAAVPPDVFDVAATPRGGRGIEQRLLIAFGGTDRPAGFASATPRATLAPEADAFVARRLGPIDGITIRLLDGDRAEVGRRDLGELGLAALDIAADAAGTSGSVPFPLLLDRARRVAGLPAATAIGLDPEEDGALLDLLEHAAAWHRALAGRRPLATSSVQHRGDGTTPDPQAAALAAVRDLGAGLTAAPDADLPLWGLFVPAGGGVAADQRAGRAKALAAATDPIGAADALFGGHAVVTGSLDALPAPLASSLADAAGLGVADRGAVAGWLQDTGRVREAARALDGALLIDEVAGRGPVDLGVAQAPVAPFTGLADAGLARRWVGLPFPAGARLGKAPALSVVIAGEPGPGPLIGLELDAWVETVPLETGVGAVAANLSSPDARAPNTILLAVPADSGAVWTESALFSVVDEAIELAECRLVDLDATRRIPAVLPSVYVADYEEPTRWVDVVRGASVFPDRYLAKGTP